MFEFKDQKGNKENGILFVKYRKYAPMIFTRGYLEKIEEDGE